MDIVHNDSHNEIYAEKIYCPYCEKVQAVKRPPEIGTLGVDHTCIECAKVFHVKYDGMTGRTICQEHIYADDSVWSTCTRCSFKQRTDNFVYDSVVHDRLSEHDAHQAYMIGEDPDVVCKIMQMYDEKFGSVEYEFIKDHDTWQLVLWIRTTANYGFIDENNLMGEILERFTMQEIGNIGLG